MALKKLLPCIFLISTVVHAQKYTPGDDGSKVHFTIKNFGFETGGDLSGIKGEIYFFTSDLTACRFNVTVDASTVDTDSDNRDDHLKGHEYFDVKNFPLISITSTRIDKTNKTESGFYYFTGNLILHGVSRPLAFPFRVLKVNDTYLFTGDFKINRLDFGIGDKSAVLSDTVNVSLSVLAKKS